MGIVCFRDGDRPDVKTIERGKLTAMGCDGETSRRNGAKSKGAVTERGKAIASRNATKHGLLAQKPPILASEDLETFQGITQALVDQYEPEGALEWHYVQTIAMCIQRQHRVWAAEAAAGNAALLPPVPEPYTDEKYPTQQKNSSVFDNKTEFHPDNLKKERELLTDFLKRYQIDDFPTKWRSKHFDFMWEDWCRGLNYFLEGVRKEYPIDRSQFLDETTLKRMIRKLNEENYPFGKLVFFRPDSDSCPTSKWGWEYERSKFLELLESFEVRLKWIDDIEAEIKQENDRYQRELEEQRLAIANPIPHEVALISRWVHPNKGT